MKVTLTFSFIACIIGPLTSVLAMSYFEPTDPLNYQQMHLFVNVLVVTTLYMPA